MHNKPLPFTLGEYDGRIQRVRECMRARKVDVLIADQTEFLAYLTGYSISDSMYRACLLPLDGDPLVVLREVDRTPFEESSWLTKAQSVGFSDWENPLDVLAAMLHSQGWTDVRLGIDEDSYCMPLRRFKQLQARLPGAAFVDFSGVLEKVRAIKSPEEIAYLRRAALLADLAMADIAAQLHEGSTPREAAGVAHASYIKNGGDSIRSGIFAIGSGDAFLHAGLSNRPLTKGDVLHAEVIPTVGGYGARLMRPIIFGEPDAPRARLARHLLEAQEKQFVAMRPGVPASEIDAIARSRILKAGLRADYVNITGYTVGFYPFSTPRTSDFTRVFHPRADWVLEPGMVFHMYVSAAGIAFSETVLVTTNGIELLTRSPRDFLRFASAN
ncbi:Xaa-Pro peptidase family protein [Bradyrhizobium sp. RT11b]|uniref:M24 family metallopeptidase n=1 Tax=Bradyrhizobium sp. RT11b TaxID=3156332 RepID=UPI003391AC74